MKRYKKLGILLGVLAVVCIAAFAAMRFEQRQEDIRNSGETVLEIAPDAVTGLVWEHDGETLSFHKGDKWLYDKDEAFPVDEEKIRKRLELFEKFGAAFVIENVEDYAQYGLDKPVCTIKLTAGETAYEIKLGSFSTLDSQRYVDIGDGKVYLVNTDPLDLFGVELKDMIDNDEPLKYDQVTSLRFSGGEPYSVSYEKDSKKSLREDDVYFAQVKGETLPLDTALVNGYLKLLGKLDLDDYATYNVTEAQLKEYGLDDPELTVTVDYTSKDENRKEVSGTFALQVSRDPQERKAEEAVKREDAPDEPKDGKEEKVTAYARVRQSQIVYWLSPKQYKALISASYNDLRHREVIPAAVQDIKQVDVTLEGSVYTFTAQGKGEKRAWSYGETQLENNDIQTALENLKVKAAKDYTSNAPGRSKKEELAFVATLEDGTQIEVRLYRHDGEKCLAVVDGKSLALIPREDVVKLIEAVNAVVLS